MNKIARLKELVEQLNQWSYEYYTLGTPTVGDKVYDKYYDELLQLEEETGLIMSNSPTQRVGDEVIEGLKKVTHVYPLLSLDKKHTVQEIKDFSNNKEIVGMTKADGLTTDIVYDADGNLIRGESRGNGIIGEDITHNVKTYTNIPLKIKPQGKEIHIIGESIMTYDIFNELKEKFPDIRNPRNLCSGSVRQFDASICRQRKIKFFGYIVEGLDFSTKIEQLEFIKELGFDTVDYMVLNKDCTNEDIENVLRTIKNKTQEKQFPMDGVVFMYNDIAYGKSLGRTIKFPKHSIAYKYEDEMEETVITNIRWQIGRTSVITPVADFETVELDGTEVSKATVNNVSILKELNLNVGSRVLVKKANCIIPQIVENLTKATDTLVEIPQYVEGHETEVRQSVTKDGIKEFLYLKDSENNSIVLSKKISHYVSREGMNMMGLSEKKLTKLINLGFVKSPLDLYSLAQHKAEIIKLEGFGAKSYEKLINSIEISKKCKLENFIYALGIPNVGLSTAKNMIKFAKSTNIENTLSNIKNFYVNKWLQMNDCGDSLANSIVDWFNDEDNHSLWYNLIDKLEFVEEETQQTENLSLDGQVFVITGDVHIYSNRKAIQQVIEGLGGKVTGSVSKKTNYLINNDVESNSGKNKKAKELNIPIISEEQFQELIGR